jgi:hypothetical protein
MPGMDGKLWALLSGRALFCPLFQAPPVRPYHSPKNLKKEVFSGE